VLNVQYVWESLKNVGGVADVFETCIDFGLNVTSSKKIAQKWQAAKKNSYPQGAGL